MNEVFLLCIAIGSPIAAVVAFAVQLRTVKKVRLENSKLELEIAKLRHELELKDRRVVLATPEETDRIAGPRFSRSHIGINPGPDDDHISDEGRSTFMGYLTLAGIAVVASCFVAYLFYDVWRLGKWLFSLFL